MNLACWYENANNIFEISPAVGIGTQEPAPSRPRHKAQATQPPVHHQRAQQARFDRFCREYNEERPHEALPYRIPASRDWPSSRSMPAKPPAPAYPGHYLVRHVSNAGTLRFQTHQLFMSDMLVEGDMALEEAADGIWSIDFSNVLVVRLDARDFRLYAGTRVIDGAGLHCHRCARLLQGRGSTVARSLS